MEKDLGLWNSSDEISQVKLNRIDKTGIEKQNRLEINGFDEIEEIDFELSSDNSKIELIEGISLSSLFSCDYSDTFSVIKITPNK